MRRILFASTAPAFTLSGAPALAIAAGGSVALIYLNRNMYGPDYLCSCYILWHFRTMQQIRRTRRNYFTGVTVHPGLDARAPGAAGS
jgi:hypothetical protein